MCTLVLAESLALFFAKNFAPQFLPSWIALSSYFPLPKTLHFSKQFAFFALSNGVIGIEAAKQTIEFPAAPFFFLVEKNRKNESN